MKTQKKLEKLGIIKKEELDPKQINYLAHFMADSITKKFPVLQLQYNEILAKILNCKMYYAKIPDNISKVNYIYEDDSIYIDESVNILEPNEQFYHEILHFLQVVRKNSGKIKKMGLCDFGDFAIAGLGLNEALVQYMSSKIMENEKQNVVIGKMKIKTISPNSYPMLTNLMEQLIYLIGEDKIIQYAMNINDEFDNDFYNTFEEKTNQIIKNFDKILDIKTKMTLENSKKEELEKEAVEIYKETQKMMIIKYYFNIVSLATEEKEIDLYIEKLLENKEYIGIDENKEFSGANLFDEYKKVIMEKINKQLIKINKEKQRKALVKYNNKLIRFLKRTISYLFN